MRHIQDKICWQYFAQHAIQNTVHSTEPVGTKGVSKCDSECPKRIHRHALSPIGVDLTYSEDLLWAQQNLSHEVKRDERLLSPVHHVESWVEGRYGRRTSSRSTSRGALVSILIVLTQITRIPPVVPTPVSPDTPHCLTQRCSGQGHLGCIQLRRIRPHQKK